VQVVEHGGSRLGYGSTIRMAPEQRVGVIILANRTGAGLPATADKAMELMLPLKPRTVPARRVMEVTADDLRRHPGVYQNGDARIEVTARDGRLYLKRGRTAEVALNKLGADRFGVEGASGEFVFVAGERGVSEYVASGSRSLARQ
jgi:CubicO group peptidase (beta-lactamase class C family)